MHEGSGQTGRQKRAMELRLLATVPMTVIATGMVLVCLLWVSVFTMSRTDVSGDIVRDGDDLPDVSYALLIEQGSFEAKCYEALVKDFGDGVCPPSWNVAAWAMLPERDSSEGDAKHEDTSDILTSVAKFVILDFPEYASYLHGNMSFEIVGNRYRPEACSSTAKADILNSYTTIQSLIDANSVTLIANSENSRAKYACVTYRFLCETISCSSSAEGNDVQSALERSETGNLGLALTMKMLLDKGDIPNYIAYGTFVDTGIPYTWNVAWINDSWKVFDVPSGCRQIQESFPEGTTERWALDSNAASIPILLPGCMVEPDSYAAQVTQNEICEELQLRYEAVVSAHKSQVSEGEANDGERPSDIAEDAVNPLMRLRYVNLLDDAERRFYDAVAEDLVSGRRVDENNPESWFVSPVEIKNNDDCDNLTEVASCVMYDSPVLSVTNGGGGWVLRYWSKKSSFGYISRYCIASPISGADGNIAIKMESTRNMAHSIFEQAEAESGGDERKFVYAAYRDISSNCFYSDDVDDSVHHNDAYGALVEGESKCYGVSCAMKMLLDEKGIPNFIAFGTLNGDNHAWNMVNIDGEWFACDLTAGSILIKDAYAIGTLNRDVLDESINEIDSFYEKCLVPADEFYTAEEGVVPSDLSLRLQESYEE